MNLKPRPNHVVDKRWLIGLVVLVHFLSISLIDGSLFVCVCVCVSVSSMVGLVDCKNVRGDGWKKEQWSTVYSYCYRLVRLPAVDATLFFLRPPYLVYVRTCRLYRKLAPHTSLVTVNSQSTTVNPTNKPIVNTLTLQFEFQILLLTLPSDDAPRYAPLTGRDCEWSATGDALQVFKRCSFSNYLVVLKKRKPNHVFLDNKVVTKRINSSRSIPYTIYFLEPSGNGRYVSIVLLLK